MAIRLSLVIPAYNEEQRIGDTLRLAQAYLSRQAYQSEIIVVDDGSQDRTAVLVQTVFPDVRVISYERNRGKGYAVKTGMLAATGEYRVFCDADGSTRIEEVGKFWPRFEAGADIVIGSRALPESDIQIRQHYLRESMGRMFNVLVKLLLREQFLDTQCGFKGFTAESARLLFPRQRLDRFTFDAELLYIARKHGLRVEETPVIWCNVPHSRVHLVWDSLRMFADLIRIRLNDFAGKYQ